MSDLQLDASLFELFRVDTGQQVASLSAGLLALERGEGELAPLMRAAHSVKGAARVVGVEPAVVVAHALEECLLAAQRGQVAFSGDTVDVLLRATDLLAAMAAASEVELAVFGTAHAELIERTLAELARVTAAPGARAYAGAAPGRARPESAPPVSLPPRRSRQDSSAPTSDPDRFVRVATGHLDRLLGLAGETLVEARSMAGFVGVLDRIRRQQAALGDLLGRLDRAGIVGDPGLVAEVKDGLTANRREVAAARGELDDLASRFEEISARMYRATLKTRMRPFREGAVGFDRVVRDLARQLGRDVELVVIGEDTPVDRDILERIEAPLNQLVCNAVAHGLERPAERIAAGKAGRGRLRLEAHHAGGVLAITVADDGRGIDAERIRGLLVSRGLVDPAAAAAMGEAQVIEHIFNPGFSTAAEVSNLAGRGIGLDIVRSTIQQLGGSLRTTTEAGRGTAFHLSLPLTRSVTRAVVVHIAGEPFGFPLLRTDRLLSVPVGAVRSIEGRPYLTVDGEHLGLVPAHQILELPEPPPPADRLAVVVVGDGAHRIGLHVDRIVGEQDLVVHPLDPRLGRVADLAAAAVTAGGEPMLVIDVEDLVRSVVALVAGGGSVRAPLADVARPRPRVLVADDTLTLRELYRQMLTTHGYDVTVAVDGLAAWNLIRESPFDLVVSDIDMPRMTGLDLVRSIKQDPRLRTIPVIIASYRARPEDRVRGLDAGADYYLGKGDLGEDELIEAVHELIGPPR